MVGPVTVSMTNTKPSNGSEDLEIVWTALIEPPDALEGSVIDQMADTKPSEGPEGSVTV